MNEFSPRAIELAAKITDRPTEPVEAELEQLRSLWRAMDGAARTEAAGAAAALAEAHRRRGEAEADRDAERAIMGLDRVEAGAPTRRVFEGTPDPDALLAHFGFGEFRPGQREAVLAALDGRDSLVVMPTGGGKSLCYQLPGIASSQLTVVVSPLIALMADQYRRLVLAGHPAAMIASGMDKQAVTESMHAVRDGIARIVFCSPERFASAPFMNALSERTVDLFAVDEAHCVSEWGHDFRPDYLRLRGVIDRLGSPTVMACTATATEQVAQEISARLALRDPFIVRSGFDRPSLSFDVVALDGKGSKARKQMLLSGALADPANRPSIVYCGTRRDVEEVSDRLRDEGLHAVGYHAGMPADERAVAQHRFMEGDADVVVATNAFGMGVDKADVRSVIHWAIPKSVESYYQEVGRAGRDGRPARAILLAMRADLGRLINFIERNRVDAGAVLDYIRELKARSDGEAIVIDRPRRDSDGIRLGVAERAGLCALESAPGGRLRLKFASTQNTAKVAAICKAALDRDWRAYRAVEAFVSRSQACRRRALLDHFGDSRPGAPIGRCCDACDPDTIGLPDPGSLVPSAGPKKAKAAAPIDPADAPLLDRLKSWRLRASDGKPAYTVAHNATLESIAAIKPSSLDQLAEIKGVGPAFVERHGEQVLELLPMRNHVGRDSLEG